MLHCFHFWEICRRQLSVKYLAENKWNADEMMQHWQHAALEKERYRRQVHVTPQILVHPAERFQPLILPCYPPEPTSVTRDHTTAHQLLTLQILEAYANASDVEQREKLVARAVREPGHPRTHRKVSLGHPDEPRCRTPPST